MSTQTPEQILAKIRELSNEQAIQLLEKGIHYEAFLTVHASKLETEVVALRTIIAKKDEILRAYIHALVDGPENLGNITADILESECKAALALTPESVTDQLAEKDKRIAELEQKIIDSRQVEGDYGIRLQQQADEIEKLQEDKALIEGIESRRMTVANFYPETGGQAWICGFHTPRKTWREAARQALAQSAQSAQKK